jgi:hypothetical protein
VEQLLDYLVGDRKYVWPHLNAERTRRLMVDGEQEFG